MSTSFLESMGRWSWRKALRAGVAAAAMLLPALALAQGTGGPAPSTPSATATCVVSALNRNATMVGNDYYMINGVPGSIGPYRIRAVCSDGAKGQSAVVMPPAQGGTAFDAGAIVWGQVAEIPLSLELVGPAELSYSESAQYRLMARMRDGSVRDVSTAAAGAGYKVTPSAWWHSGRYATAGAPSTSYYGDRLSDDGRHRPRAAGVRPRAASRGPHTQWQEDRRRTSRCGRHRPRLYQCGHPNAHQRAPHLCHR